MPKNPVEYERKQEMAQLLSGLDGTDLDGAVKIIREDESHLGDDDNEIELDFDLLSPMTVSKLDKYLRRIRPGGISTDHAEEISDNESSDDD